MNSFHLDNPSRLRSHSGGTRGDEQNNGGLRFVARRGRRNACWELPAAEWFSHSPTAGLGGAAGTGREEAMHDVLQQTSPEPHRVPRRQRRNAIYEIDPADLPRAPVCVFQVPGDAAAQRAGVRQGDGPRH